ncbi:hypothetical protein M422DRAFT_240153 [Sphaerobolus stellatus SS14]|nr:hypothetical protein M422DRAFT_240153 [Sphaerobolus stellatus SS14]
MSAEHTCEPREKPGPYGPREQKQKKKDQPKSSTQPGRQKRHDEVVGGAGHSVWVL